MHWLKRWKEGGGRGTIVVCIAERFLTGLSLETCRYTQTHTHTHTHIHIHTDTDTHTHKHTRKLLDSGLSSRSMPYFNDCILRASAVLGTSETRCSGRSMTRCFTCGNAFRLRHCLGTLAPSELNRTPLLAEQSRL